MLGQIWVEDTKMKQEVIGYGWIIETEGKLVKKYQPEYETRSTWFGLSEKTVEINRPRRGRCWDSINGFFYIDEHLDTRQITPNIKPHFRMMKGNGE